jgi:flagellar biosynthesis protein FlhF
MKIKKIVAPTMKEALRMVKLELGEDAIILKSSKVNRGGLFSFLTKERIEVTAAIDYPLPERNNATPLPPKPSQIVQKNPSPEKYLLYDIRDEVVKIDGALREIGEKLKYDSMPSLPQELSNYYITLVENGVEMKHAADLVQEIYAELNPKDYANPVLVGKAVQEKLRSMFSVVGGTQFQEGKTTIVALIGPTGVGKTTTIAKIASQYKFFGGKKVALVSADTYRMAAVEQLRTFARIASLPLEVVYQPQDMPSAIQKHRDKDLIVIDTAGRSHRDKEKMRELAAFIEAAEAVEIHLTLSVGTKLNDLIDIVDRFKVVPSTCYLFTKLDETTNFGNILNLIKHRPKSISLFTLGQNVPDDIAWAEKGSLARLMLSRDLDEAAISKGLYVRPSAKTQRISIG